MSTGSDIRVRDAREDERGAVGELTLAAYAQYARVMTADAWAGLERALRAALASHEPVERIVAERGGRLIGSVLLYPPATDAYNGAVAWATWPEVRLLAVSSEARGQGVGRRLMDECVRRARAAGATEIGIHTSSSMKAAMQMYARMGFVRAPEYDFQPPGAELVAAYQLTLEGASSEVDTESPAW